MEKSKCKCGRVKSKWLSDCSKCCTARMDKAHAEAMTHVATGKCPICGESLRRNASMAGWYQCAQLGAEQFRKDPSKPSCNFQCFTE